MHIRWVVPVAIAACGRDAKPPPPDLPAAATALERAAGHMDDQKDRSDRVWNVLRGKDVARDLLAKDAVGLRWLSGRGYTTYPLGAWGGVIEWSSSLTDSILDKAKRPGALVRCDGATCVVEDIDRAWTALGSDDACGWLPDFGSYEVYGLERESHRYVLMTAVRSSETNRDVTELGIRVLHGERNAPTFAFAAQPVADAALGVLGPVTSGKGCSIVTWHGGVRDVPIKSDDRSVKLLPGGGFVRLTPGSDDELHVDTK